MEKFRVEVKVRIIKDAGMSMYENLSVEETISVEAAGFMEICAILGRFHGLSETLKAEQQQE